MILLDTTVLVYAVGADHAQRDPCRAIIDDIGAGRLTATTTVEVIQEFVHVRARRRGRADARRLGEHYVDLLSPLVAPDADDVRHGLALWASHESIGAFDSVLAAVVLRRDDLAGLATVDRAFADIAGLDVIDPSTR